MAFNIKAEKARTYKRYEDVPLDEIPADIAELVEECITVVEEDPAYKFTLDVDENDKPYFATADETDKTWGEILSYGKHREKGAVKIVRDKGTEKNPVADTVLRFRLYLPTEPETA